MNKLFIIIFFTFFSFNSFAQKDYQSYIKDALDYTDAREFAAAEQSYKAALRTEPANPGNSMLLMNLGTIQRYLKKYDEALISYNLVVQKYPTLSHILKNRALLYCEMNRYDDALKDYSTIILHNSEDIEALYERALIYITLKKLDEADGDFKKILTFDKDNYKGRFGTALILKRKGEWEEAEQVYSDLIYEYKRQGELYANRAEVYFYLKKLRNMKEDLDKAINYGYNDTSVYILKGQYQLAQYDKEAAKKEFIKAKEMGADENLVNDFLRLCK